MLESAAIAFRGCSQNKARTPISCISYIAGGFFTAWAIGEALYYL